MKPVTKDWINFAKDDLDAAKSLSREDHLTNVVSFHAHQTIEKCFKAVMEEKHIDFQKTHNLVTLCHQISAVLTIECQEDILLEVNELYISSRYPSDIGLLPSGKPTQKEADTFLTLAEEIFNKVTSFLES